MAAPYMLENMAVYYAEIGQTKEAQHAEDAYFIANNIMDIVSSYEYKREGSQQNNRNILFIRPESSLTLYGQVFANSSGNQVSLAIIPSVFIHVMSKSKKEIFLLEDREIDSKKPLSDMSEDQQNFILRSLKSLGEVFVRDEPGGPLGFEKVLGLNIVFP